MITLSKRLQAIADMVPVCDTFTDIGTDHGYLPVFLLSNRVCRRAVASDLRKGPLDTARRNAGRYGIDKDRIEFILSDGLDDIVCPGEGFNVLSVTGMGGPVIMEILRRNARKAGRYDAYIFSPHTKQADFRRYLISGGYTITGEKHLVDEGKLYVIIKAVKGRQEPEGGFGEVYYNFGGFIREALRDEEVRAQYLRQYAELTALISENPSIPDEKRQELVNKAIQYKEVLEIEA